MALGTYQFEVKPSTGNDLYAGGFNAVGSSAGTDYPLAGTVFTLTDLASTNGNVASPQVSSVARPFVAADIRNLIHVTAGTNWTTGYYEITAVAAGKATLDRAVGSTSTLSSGSCYLGGALATLGQVQTIGATGAATNQLCWIQGGTQNLSAGLTLTSIGRIQGYTTTRGDSGLATLKATSGTFTMINFTGPAGIRFINLVLDGNSQTAILGLSSTTIFPFMYNSTIQNCTNGAIQITGGGLFEECSIKNCQFNTSGNAYTVFATNGSLLGMEDCVIDGCNTNTNGCVVGGSTYPFFGNLIKNCTTATTGVGSIILVNTSRSTIIRNNSLHGSVSLSIGTGISCNANNLLPAGSWVFVENNIVSNSVHGIAITALGAVSQAYVNSNSVYNATLSFITSISLPNILQVGSSVNLAIDPYTASGSGTFTLNNNGNGGLLCQNMKRVFPGGLTTTYETMGALGNSSTSGTASGKPSLWQNLITRANDLEI